MTSAAIKKHLLTDEEIKLPTYSKLPPIPNIHKLPARKVISPTSVSVDFNPPDTVQSKQLLGGKVSLKKTSADLSKSEMSKLVSNQNAANKRISPLGTGGKSGIRSSGDVAFDQSNNGIELIGYRMTNGQPASSSGKLPVPPQANDWTPLSSELPPCRICGDKASGLHYGVNTCEACKAFFRRTLKKSTVNFQCTCTPEEKELGTDEPRKTTCPKCRYERCMKTGMSKDAIKIGRYTISRKRQNDQEVKTLKKGERTVGVRRVSESSKSTSSSSPYSTSQSVSSPEELSSDITSLSLQEKKEKQNGKKRQYEEEDGLLYQSLTNSIFMSLMEDQSSTPATPVEQLLSTYGKSNANVAPVEQIRNTNQETDADLTSSNPGTDESAIENLLNANEQQEEAFSPLAHILSTYSQTLEEESAIERLLAQPVNSSPSTQVVGVGNSVEAQFSPSQIQNGTHDPNSSHSGTEIATSNSVDGTALSASLFGIYNGTHINSGTNGTEQLHDTKINEESPIESLFMAPVETMPYSPPLDVTSYDGLSHMKYDSDITGLNNEGLADDHGIDSGIEQEIAFHGNGFPMTVVETDVLNEELNKANIVGQLEGDVFVASKFNENEESFYPDNEHGVFTGELIKHDNYMENPDDLEIQEMQLSRFLNPAVRVGAGLGVKEATEIILTLGKAAVVLFDNSKKMSCEEIKKRHADYLDQYVTKMQVFGDMSNISKEEYLDFYNQTGIDIDNRQQILIEALKYMEDSIAKMVIFAKAIPGFSDLDIDDQVSLVKDICRHI